MIRFGVIIYVLEGVGREHGAKRQVHKIAEIRPESQFSSRSIAVAAVFRMRVAIQIKVGMEAENVG